MHAILRLSCVLLLASTLVAQDGGGFALDELGLAFHRPGAAWTAMERTSAASGGSEYRFRAAADEDHEISLIVWRLRSHPGLEELCDSEERQVAARGALEPLARTVREVTGVEGLSTRYRLERDGGEAPVVVDATYLAAERFLARLAVTLPDQEYARLDETVSLAVSALRHVAPRPVRIGDPIATNVLTVVSSSHEEDLVYAYLEALPGAARANAGLPVALAVGTELGEVARAFVERYRPGTIRLLGPVLAELPQAVEARDVWEPGGSVVVSERSLAAAVPAAALATRLRAPLLVEDDQLDARLGALAPERVLVLGEVDLGGLAFPATRLPEPIDVARAAGGAGYIALCNVAAGTGSDAAALAAVLAATRDGVVLPVDMPMARHRVPLQVTERCPPGLEDVDGAGRYLTATIGTREGAVLVGAAQTTIVRVAGNDSPRYGRLRVDLDRDGRLDPDEEPRIGSIVDLGGRPLHLTYSYRHAFVPYLEDELRLDEFDPEALRGEIRALAGDLGDADCVAIVGTPDRVPFCYREAEGYFETYDIKQELPTDAPYANLDDDAYLELAVGRLPVRDLIEGSAMIATTIAYPRLQGDWIERATLIQPGFHELEGALPWVLPNAEALIRGIEGDLAAAGVETEGFYRTEVEIDAVLESMSRSAWIAYFNHSGPDAWGIHPGASILTGPPRRAGDRALPPLAGAPIAFGGGCSSAALDLGAPAGSSFADRFFQLGAVAYLGNTRVAYARSEHLVQLCFARLASGEATLGEAYRDSRNFLAHLLEGGHVLGPLDYGIERGVRDFLWAQHRILNLFGDPALVPRVPARAAPAIEVALEGESGKDGLRLTVSNRGALRADPVQMMPAAGQGAPREYLVAAGPGMTSSHLPHHFIDEGLAPVRSVPEVVPGAWVDVELPAGSRGISVRLAEGPAWADRGFAVHTGSRGEPRLQMVVPLVRSLLEGGRVEVADQVVFELACSASPNGVTPEQLEPRVRVEPRWSPRPSGEARISAAAQELIERARRRHGRPAEAIGEEWVLSNPQPRLYGEKARFRGRWYADGRSFLWAEDLPAFLAARREVLHSELRRIADLPFTIPLPSAEGMDAEVTPEGVLVYTSREEGDERVQMEVHLAPDGAVQRTLRRQLGLSEETRYTWREADGGLVLERRVRFDPVRPTEQVVHEVRWRGEGPELWPERVVLRLPGKLPHDVHYDFLAPGSPPPSGRAAAGSARAPAH